ncbi:hypothetical protein [Chlorobium sp. N1]|uniref:hypothetical protein n=1 Tax=Chlorobium sp. N1 TaxID=2491138 RepID=UPI00103F8F0C|nr:hypothetical protein [Chlorobium sp. N1]TCD48409.1 hypothetical protein E0L29_00505 [Chlorobium sp. N1]
MLKLSAPQQKTLKSLHIITSGLWLSSVLLLALLPLVPIDEASGEGIYTYRLIFHFIDTYVLTAAAVLTLLTGLIYSMLTKWGFFRSGWLVYKWIVTLGLVLVGTFYLGPLSARLLEIAAEERLSALRDPAYTTGDAVLAAAALINTILLALAVLFSVFKPWNRKAEK